MGSHKSLAQVIFLKHSSSEPCLCRMTDTCRTDGIHRTSGTSYTNPKRQIFGLLCKSGLSLTEGKRQSSGPYRTSDASDDRRTPDIRYSYPKTKCRTTGLFRTPSTIQTKNICQISSIVSAVRYLQRPRTTSMPRMSNSCCSQVAPTATY